MSGAAFILIITVSVACLFCAAFTFVAIYERQFVSARWFAAAFAMGVVYAVLEFLLPSFNNGKIGVFLGHTAFLVTLTLLNVGLARRFEVPLPINTIVAAFSLSLVASSLLQDLPRGSLLRMFLYQAPYFVMQAIGAWIVLKAPRLRPIDKLLAGFLVISAVHYLTKPLVAVYVGGAGSAPQKYLETTYAMISQSMGAVLVVASGLLLLATLAVDLVNSMTARSETDMISGLLNRRGFEERLAEVARNRPRTGMPTTLVMCDLDHFKAINDTYGHAFGDKVIAHFAQTLGKSALHVAARIGGEEFAVLLPQSNLGAGRNFAEAARKAFSETSANELAPGIPLTASFGVAEMTQGESVASLMARADAALYDAKRAGRDCVRVSPGLTAIENAAVGSTG
jgi:diguanylate cyclase (GGDEF)-like protein